MELKGARGNKDEKCFDCLIEPVSECVFQQVIYQSSCCIRDRSNINRTQTSFFEHLTPTYIEHNGAPFQNIQRT